MATAPFASDEDIHALVRGFEACALSHEQWTHHAHLAVGLWYVRGLGRQRAMDILRQRIIRLNESLGVANTDESGYHETLTRFYVWAIASYLAESDSGKSLVELINGLCQSRWGSRKIPLEHYTRERIVSVAARRGWVEPNRAPMDDPETSG